MKTVSRTPESHTRTTAVSKPRGAWSKVASSRRGKLAGGIASFAGSMPPADPNAVIQRSKKGLLISKLESVQAKSPFNESQWAEILDMTLRTLQRQKQNAEVLDTARSERVLLIEQMLQYGRQVFGDDDAFAIWLQSPSWPLNGKKPVELLDTATGIQLVHAAIGRIDYGVFA